MRVGRGEERRQRKKGQVREGKGNAERKGNEQNPKEQERNTGDHTALRERRPGGRERGEGNEKRGQEPRCINVFLGTHPHPNVLMSFFI